MERGIGRLGVSRGWGLVVVLIAVLAMGGSSVARAQGDSEIDRLKAKAEENPQDATLQFNLGVKLMGAGRYEEALEVNKRATEADPNLAQAWYNLGYALQNLDRWEEAGAAYKTATEVKPDYAEAFMNLGASFQKRGMAREAADTYRKCAEIKPDHVEAQFGLAWMLLALKDEAAAAEQYKVLSALDKGRADSLYNQYEAQKQQGAGAP